MTTRRPLLTAVAAGVLLCAGWLVPTANATPAHPSAHPSAPAPPDGRRLADSGSVDTTPYVYGGVGFVAVGGALVTLAVRRSRNATPSSPSGV
ncbi:hypothetical protein J7W19_20385 [Streptomyces mobaraensis NBRC 13819 = DSM 40847]|uniref:LPXTG cell wall anchor domain-containing protein n=2 Tax=Streptomyces mobaraensis TaxID=35621 RepID=A0A5N5WEV9_STRMB|nr:hypothetical protein [Streptomyces mobaraensis]EME98515.1 hypothetical protein H340_21051 [Streptomyces mobaraensis NBRC 13819 = DSM 40847]KAB7852495.1 hypothetical protein FRZ00_01545 [Streptomyces mobaraensis]QTT75416.1 hypothetical protein J7W19_20385 [Streptomyces mobaraensis NBRC 13819 = DSM 40847]